MMTVGVGSVSPPGSNNRAASAKTPVAPSSCMPRAAGMGMAVFQRAESTLPVVTESTESTGSP